LRNFESGILVNVQRKKFCQLNSYLNSWNLTTLSANKKKIKNKNAGKNPTASLFQVQLKIAARIRPFNFFIKDVSVTAEKDGFGRFVRKGSIDFDPSWLGGFGVVDVRRGKDRLEDYKDPFKRMKGSRRPFKIGQLRTKRMVFD